MNKKNIFSFILIIIFIVFLFAISHKHNVVDVKEVKIAGQDVKVELALTDVKREQGLSGRTSLSDNEGMLFVFDHSDKYLFWMKDMNFSIDMIWISEDMKVVYIKKDARPESYPESYGPGVSDKKAKYVLEVVSGFGDKNTLKVGDSVEFLFSS
ncbi:MAG TPA: DUF192 domain-containing protein [Candidatus Paceibacterota bacterium]|nr:DUF192 domain-containing protein [Candidatus Paceibacterota bacterium]